MQNFADSIADEATSMVFTVAIWTLLISGLLIASLMWLAMSTLNNWIDQQKLRYETRAVFDRVRNESIPNLAVDPVLKSIFGDDVEFSETDPVNSDDWLTRTIFETI